MYGICRVLFAACALVWAISCGGKPPLEQPGGSGGAATVVSVDYLKSMYVSAPLVIERNIRIEGRVVSDDCFGNFYKTLCIEDVTGGIALRLDMTDIFKTCRRGSIVAVNCNSLVLGAYGGAVQLGAASTDASRQVDPLPDGRIASHLVPDAGDWAMPEPTVLRMEELSPRYINCYVKIEQVQFVEGEIGLTWSDEGLDTNRHITDRGGNTLIVRSSGHSVFAQRLLPEGSGYITGVLGYFNGDYQLVLPADGYILFMSGERF